MNLHPILVHFPIALLTTYSLLELFRLPLLTKQSYYFYLKAFLVIAGILMALPTIVTGLLVQSQFANAYLVDLHQWVNISATVLFGVLGASYAVTWLNHNPPKMFKKAWWWKMKVKVAGFILQTPIVLLITLVAFFLVTIGGALGGIIVYGSNIDPFTQILSQILHLQ